MTRDIRDRLELFMDIDWLTDAMTTDRATRGDIREHMAEWLRHRGNEDNEVGRLPVTVKRIALNMDQIDEYDPPPNPAKLTDSRARGYVAEHGYESWELDALEPSVLTNLIEEEIGWLIDTEVWDARLDVENEMRSKLAGTARRFRAEEEEE